MSKKDKLKEEITLLRDEYKNYFIVIMTLLTGSFTAYYQVIVGNVPLFILLIGTFGFLLSLFVIILFKKRRLDIDKKLDDLEKEK